MQQAPRTERLSLPLEQLKDYYPVVVVGSGYGGAISASRLARAGQQVCLLERGKEFAPDAFPNTRKGTQREVQVDSPHGRIGPRTGLYDFRVNNELNVIVGCGLGGTSLINANVALRATPGVFQDPVWPEELRNDIDTIFEEGYRRTEEMLRPQTYPDHLPRLNKVLMHQRAAEGMGVADRFRLLPLNVTFEDGVNHVGVEQKACTLCGDCVSGCNFRAKNTLAMNYLPDARNHGAAIFTQVPVRRVERREGKWLVHYEVLDGERSRSDSGRGVIRCDLVVLAAGSLGSTEILFRSRAAGLPLSGQLGKHFSSNGDFIGFAYNCDAPVDAVGHGHRPPEGRQPVGPCISAVIDLRDPEDPDAGVVLEDGTIHGAFAGILPLTFAVGHKPFGRATRRGLGDFLRGQARILVSLISGPYRGAVRHTQSYLLAGHDDATGEMRLQDDRVRISWPDLHKHKNFTEADLHMFEAAAILGGVYVRNPVWSRWIGHDLITAHPLGGCVMADDASEGVVNHKGQVFSGAEGDEVYEGLYVSDGAVIPRSLGANPLLTISALAERCVALLAQDRGWRIDYQLPRAQAVAR